MATFTVIDHEELTGDVATWTSATIPASYDHLYLTISARGDLAGSNYYVYLDVQFNGDTGTNYGSSVLWTGDTSPGAGEETGASGMDRLILINSDATLADSFGTASIWVPNYANTTDWKTALGQFFIENNTTTNSEWLQGLGVGLWESTAAITSITIDPKNDGLMQYSSFTLYGIKGA